MKLALFPIFSLLSRKVGFAFFYKNNGEWKLWTRGVSIPVRGPSASAFEYFRHFVPAKGGIVFDVGAERGTQTQQFSRIVGERGTVYAFECLPSHSATLNQLARNLKNVRVIDKACWNQRQKLTFYEGQTPGSGTAVADAKGQRGQALANTHRGGFEVEADTLDRLWREYARSHTVDFLKMDIEGAECEALEGATSLLANTRKVVVAAYHWRDNAPTAARVAERLKAAGFTVRVDENAHVYGTR